MEDKKKFHRRSIRIKEYDYSKEGMYFITICTQGREKILSTIGECDDEESNDCRGRVPSLPKNTKLGLQIENVIKYMNAKYENISIGPYVIMPNHLHMIVEIQGRGGTLPLQDIIRMFKSYTTRIYIKTKRKLGKQKLWQRNYYEHVIRNEKEYWKVCEYIELNPLKWKYDEYYRQ